MQYICLKSKVNGRFVKIVSLFYSNISDTINISPRKCCLVKMTHRNIRFYAFLLYKINCNFVNFWSILTILSGTYTGRAYLNTAMINNNIVK